MFQDTNLFTKVQTSLLTESKRHLVAIDSQEQFLICNGQVQKSAGKVSSNYD